MNREEGRQDERLVKDIEQHLELSAAWRALLGLESPAPGSDAAGDPAASNTPVLKNDPWAALVQMQGIQVVDLQQVHTLPAQRTPGENDVELALNNIQEQEP
jgi:hypothetical protein